MDYCEYEKRLPANINDVDYVYGKKPNLDNCFAWELKGSVPEVNRDFKKILAAGSIGVFEGFGAFTKKGAPKELKSDQSIRKLPLTKSEILDRVNHPENFSDDEVALAESCLKKCLKEYSAIHLFTTSKAKKHIQNFVRKLKVTRWLKSHQIVKLYKVRRNDRGLHVKEKTKNGEYKIVGSITVSNDVCDWTAIQNEDIQSSCYIIFPMRSETFADVESVAFPDYVNDVRGYIMNHERKTVKGGTHKRCKMMSLLFVGVNDVGKDQIFNTVKSVATCIRYKFYPRAFTSKVHFMQKRKGVFSQKTFDKNLGTMPLEKFMNNTHIQWNSITTYDLFFQGNKIPDNGAIIEKLDFDLCVKQVDQNAMKLPKNLEELRVGFFDVETTGLSVYHKFTTAVLVDYTASKTEYFVRDTNMYLLPQALAWYDVIVTFNGTTFDVSRYEQQYGPFPVEKHVDLRTLFATLGFNGGQKRLENAFFAPRELDSMFKTKIDGALAPRLWKMFLPDRKVEEFPMYVSLTVYGPCRNYMDLMKILRDTYFKGRQGDGWDERRLRTVGFSKYTFTNTDRKWHYKDANSQKNVKPVVLDFIAERQNKHGTFYVYGKSDNYNKARMHLSGEVTDMAWVNAGFSKVETHRGTQWTYKKYDRFNKGSEFNQWFFELNGFSWSEKEGKYMNDFSSSEKEGKYILHEDYGFEFQNKSLCTLLAYNFDDTTRMIWLLNLFRSISKHVTSVHHTNPLKNINLPTNVFSKLLESGKSDFDTGALKLALQSTSDFETRSKDQSLGGIRPRVVLYASDVAAAIGKNPYKQIIDLMMELEMRYFKGKHFESTMDKLERVSKANNVDVDAVKEKIKAAGTATSIKHLREIQDVVEFGVPASKKDFHQSFSSLVDREYGKHRETNSIDIFKKWMGCEVTNKQQTFRKNLDHEKFSLEVRGKVDGMTDGSVLEIKTKTNNYFKFHERDKVQLYTYMYLSDVANSKLAQVFEDEVTIYEESFDPNYWKQIQYLLTNFFHMFHKYLHDTAFRSSVLEAWALKKVNEEQYNRSRFKSKLRKMLYINMDCCSRKRKQTFSHHNVKKSKYN